MNEIKPKCSYMRGVYGLSRHRHVTISRVIEAVKSDRYTKRVAEIRAAEDQDLRNQLKLTLPIITPSMLLDRDASARANDQPHEHSGIVVLDIDHAPDEQLNRFRQLVEADPSCLACFSSPSGDGVKALIRIEPLPRDPNQHYQAYSQLVEHWREKASQAIPEWQNHWIDTSGKDVCRSCFLSYDPDAHLKGLNEIEPFGWDPLRLPPTQTVNDGVEAPVFTQEDKYQDYDPAWAEKGRYDIDRYLDEWLRDFKQAPEGSRHATLVNRVLLPAFKRMVVPYTWSRNSEEVKEEYDALYQTIIQKTQAVAIEVFGAERAKREMNAAADLFRAVAQGKYGGAYIPKRALKQQQNDNAVTR